MLFNSKRELSIDDGILRVLLNVTRYKHGARSMTDVIEMSHRAGKKRFDLSAPPVKKQLDMHVDAIETMAKREHDRWVWQKIMQGWTYKEGKKDFVNKTSPFIIPWNKLPPDTRINDFNAVRLIPKMLKEAGYKAYKSDSEKSD